MGTPPGTKQCLSALILKVRFLTWEAEPGGSRAKDRWNLILGCHREENLGEEIRKHLSFKMVYRKRLMMREETSPLVTKWEGWVPSIGGAHLRAGDSRHGARKRSRATHLRAESHSGHSP